MASFHEKATPTHGVFRGGSSRYNTLQTRRETPYKRVKSGADENNENPAELSSQLLIDRTIPQSLHRTYSAPNGWNGGDTILEPSPARDRRAMLEDWRRRKGRHVTGIDSTSRKRVKRIPSSCRAGYHNRNDLQDTHSSTIQNKSYDDRDEETPIRKHLATPGQGKLGSARRSSLMEKSVLSSTPEVHRKGTHPSSSNSALVDTIDDAGFQSQMERMKRRLEQLEKEKMDLSMSKAPLEARIRQKEDAWMKERACLMQEVQCSRLSLRKIQNDQDVWDVREKLRASEEELKSTRLAKTSLEKELHATKIELDCLERNNNKMQAEYDEIAAQTSDNRDAEIKLQVLTEEHMATSAALNAVYAELDATKARAEATISEKDERLRKEIEQLRFDLSVMKTRANKVQLDLNKSIQNVEDEDEAVLRARIEERDQRIIELEAELLKGEKLRRHMHNCIQELRGNIRVFVRTRPFLPGDEQDKNSPINITPDGESMSIIDRRSGKPLNFHFDKVFLPSAGQETVFQEVSDFVQSALDGYNVCLFSYGQTGSGKTHTMQGCGNGPMRGIIPRAVEQVLAQANNLSTQKWAFTLSASFLEIYNEGLKDLLVSIHSGQNSIHGQKLSIKRDNESKMFVQGLTTVPIDTTSSSEAKRQLEALMMVAAQSRSVASTKMNSQSSRSHSIFMMQLKGFNEDTGASVCGALNLCDLAGSERLDRSEANFDSARLKETQSINKSLSCLGVVFNSLAIGASHIPYRNSKLTYLLQDCLSGDGKALMFVNLSPTTESSGESLCSLRFAQRVNQVELGKATKNIAYTKT
ncbi:unnamed protein product [Cylindrotheca closterium]|uniref:Kinesin motor domain-containing protein n=1 Tax=Cylindrotheca closterium TaxID=2856 RepID=A0AAD2JJ54_9STRA|nr:unnamed protein product [Cylindrotheca closterium]